MTVRFRYEHIGKHAFGDVFRPVAQVSFQSPQLGTWTTTWTIVDTGADFSILPSYIAEDLGISLENDCTIDTTSGVGGNKTIHLLKQKITAKIGTTTRQVPLAFFGTDEVPPLLGRLGFLETFNVEFLKSHTVTFQS